MSDRGVTYLGHATVAFAAATMAADRHPDQAPWWYGAAALIGWSRVRKNRHRTEDVLAGLKEVR